MPQQRRASGPALPAACPVAHFFSVVQALTSFGLSQVLGVAAQKAITDMRRRVQQHIMRLPVRFYDTTQTGVLVSRVMTDAEGIRNLVGTGLVQLVGSVVTAVFGLHRRASGAALGGFFAIAQLTVPSDELKGLQSGHAVISAFQKPRAELRSERAESSVPGWQADPMRARPCGPSSTPRPLPARTRCSGS